jgi:hypothetical protein
LTNASSGENTPNNIDEGTITVTLYDATVNKADDLPAMVEALKNLASQPDIHTVNTETYIYDDSPAPVAPGRMVRHKRDERSIDQYSTAGTFYIRINADDGSLRSELRVGLSAKVNDDELSKTLCTDLFTVGSAVAGTFTGGAAAAAGDFLPYIPRDNVLIIKQA